MSKQTTSNWRTRAIKQLKNAATIAGIVTAAALPAKAEAQIRPTLGYNAIEAGMNNTQQPVVKLHTNINLQPIHYHGTNLLVADTHIGRQVLYTGNQHIATIAAAQTSNEGITSWEAGIRNQSLPERIATYGFVDLALNNEQHELVATGLLGTVHGKHSAEAFIRTNFTQQPYIELQVARELNKHASIFIRGESAKNYRAAIAGISIRRTP